MRVVIVGAGALGGLVGALLHRAGESVAFVARGEALARVRERGIEVQSPLGDATTGPLPAAESPAALGVADLVLVAVKAFQVRDLAPALRPLVGPSTCVLTTQNGVQVADELAAVLGQAVAVGVWHVLARSRGPASVVHRGPPPRLAMGERPGGPSPRLQALLPLFGRAGIQASVDEQLPGAQWEKLLFVEPFGVVGAAARQPIDVLRALPETRALLEAAMEEVASVARARGVTLQEGAVARSLARLDALPEGATASLHRDLAEGRPSELEEQTGVLLRLAREAGLPLPVHQTLYALLRSSLKASPPGDGRSAGSWAAAGEGSRLGSAWDPSAGTS
jgi:2-dehydropantoate 2-reductase